MESFWKWIVGCKPGSRKTDAVGHKNSHVMGRFLIMRTLKFSKNKKQLDATYYFIVLLIGSTCFGHYYAHHQELATLMLITTLAVSFLVCCMLEVRCG